MPQERLDAAMVVQLRWFSSESPRDDYGKERTCIYLLAHLQNGNASMGMSCRPFRFGLVFSC